MKVYIFKNSEPHATTKKDDAIEVRDVKISGTPGVYDYAAHLLRDGIYEFSIEDDGGVLLFDLSCYSDLLEGVLSKYPSTDPKSWAQYVESQPEDPFDRYEDDLNEGLVEEYDSWGMD